jgi:hypothetical protein
MRYEPPQIERRERIEAFLDSVTSDTNDLIN